MFDNYITFPKEVWWLIFSQSKNPLRLFSRFYRASREFKLLIEDYFKENEIFKKLCEGNIEFWANQIISKVHPNKLIDLKRPLSPEDYKEVLKYYYKWRSPKAFSTLVTEFGYGLKEEITCTTVWRDFLVAGSTSGKVFLSDIEKDHDQIAIGFENNHAVKNLKVWLAEKDLEVVVVQLQNKYLKFFNLTTQDEKPLPSLLIYYANNICVGVDNRFFVEYGYNITEYKFNYGKIIFRRTCDVSILLKSSIKLCTKFLTMHSEGDLLMVMIQIDDEVQIFELNFSTDVYKDPKMVNRKVIRILNIFELKNTMISVIPHKELELIFCDYRLAACSRKFSKNDQCCLEYGLLELENDFITCAAMYANILLLGWNSGLFSRIYLNSLEDFNHFNNPPHPLSNTFQLSLDPIIAINLGEFAGISYIIVTTKNGQYLITSKQYSDKIHLLKSIDSDDDDDDDDDPHLSKRMRLS
ncbi:GSCOCG00002252001-RA-CDS [Cotesia congregata]|uniref:Uncharacterized protein n=1 Tax=Cotesia congregata TaxID=51543 RepID=A0A8J2HNL5_COTCN|nr:GSCOCG00002252001-RA-CDS [Cotesia congregata]CAG5103853.1 Protein of unknown function [Cotesia congregata]